MLWNEVEIICCFTSLSYKIFRMDCETCLTKDQFLHKIFSRLNREEINTIEKISVCMNCENYSEVFPFIQECSGKYWFHEIEDRDNVRIRNDYLLRY